MTSGDNKPKFIKKDYRVWNDAGRAALQLPDNNPTDQPPTSLTLIKATYSPTGEITGKSNVSKTIASTDTQSIVITSCDKKKNKIENDIVSITPNNAVSKKQLNRIAKKEITTLIRSLTGLQEKIFYLVLICCTQDNNLQTSNLKTIDIAELIKSSKFTAKNAITRIVNKKIIQRLSGKTSSSGFVRFAITKETKKAGDILARDKKITDAEFKEFIAQVKQKLKKCRQKLGST